MLIGEYYSPPPNEQRGQQHPRDHVAPFQIDIKVSDHRLLVAASDVRDRSQAQEHWVVIRKGDIWVCAFLPSVYPSGTGRERERVWVIYLFVQGIWNMNFNFPESQQCCKRAGAFCTDPKLFRICQGAHLSQYVAFDGFQYWLLKKKAIPQTALRSTAKKGIPFLIGELFKLWITICHNARNMFKWEL